MMRVKATYEGGVLRLFEPLGLPAGTEVLITIESPRPKKKGEPYAVLKAALAANLDGPPDSSEQIANPTLFDD